MTRTNLILMTLICVVIFIAPAPAAELSPKILGSWCGQLGYQFSDVDDESMYWWRIEDVGGCGNRGGVRVRKHGYDYDRFGPQGSCKLTAIKFRRHGKASDLDLFVPANKDGEITEEAKAEAKAGPPPSDVYTIRATCKARSKFWSEARGKTWNESYDIQTGNNWLKFSSPAKDSSESAARFNKYKCQVTEVVEDLSTGNPKTLSPKDDLVLIEVAKNPPRMKVSHIDKKGKVVERNKQYRNGSYVLYTDQENSDTLYFTLYGSRQIGSTIYRMVGEMALAADLLRYDEKIYKNAYLDATIQAGNCSEIEK